MKEEIAAVEDVLDHFAKGGMVILVDDEDRENEGDLTVAAQSVTARDVTFMARQGRGLICLAMEEGRANRLGLKPMARVNTAPFGTAFLNSIDAREGIKTGASAADRAHTMRLAMDDKAQPGWFKTPGHVFPLAAREGGVLVRTGQTEGSVDLARLSGLRAGAVICEVMREDGTMMRLPELLKFGARYNIPVLTVASLVAYRLRKESFIKQVSRAHLPTAFGTFELYGFQSLLDGHSHVALVKGTIDPEKPVLVRVHRANFPGDVLPLEGFDSRRKLEIALKRIAEEGTGVFVYLNREEKGEDLLNALKKGADDMGGVAPVRDAVQKESNMTFRDYGIGVQVLRALGVRKMRVMTDHPINLPALEGFGVDCAEFVPLTEEETDE